MNLKGILATMVIKMHKILIAIPTFESICPETFKSIWDLYIPKNVQIDFEYVTGYDCAIARNKIAKKAIKGEYDYVLMVDSDIVLPEKALAYMLSDTPDILLAAYPRKQEPSKSEIFDIRYSQYTSSSRWNISEIKHFPIDRFAIRGGGFGCALVNVDIFNKMKFPYFYYQIYQNGSVLSEDLYFCEEARALGYEILTDKRVICGHVGKHVIKT